MKAWPLIALATVILSSGCGAPPPADLTATHRTILNGFDVSDASIPSDEIFRGGPPRDGIPSIDSPVFIAPRDVDFLQPEDTVLSFQRDGETRAYPFRILVWHEVVNDLVKGKPVAVTYCPLCGTAMVFSREIAGESLTFGVSGLLYQSDVLLYDRKTESLWTQIGMEAVSGPHKGTELEWLPSWQMKWAAWREAHPDGKVLSTETGHARDYTRNSYAGYAASPGTMFPVTKHRDELELKEWVVGIRVGENAAAYPVKNLPSGEWITDRVGGQEVRLRYDAEAESAEVELLPEKEELPHVFSYWFAWQAFYPETALWKR